MPTWLPSWQACFPSQAIVLAMRRPMLLKWKGSWLGCWSVSLAGNGHWTRIAAIGDHAMKRISKTSLTLAISLFLVGCSSQSSMYTPTTEHEGGGQSTPVAAPSTETQIFKTFTATVTNTPYPTSTPNLTATVWAKTPTPTTAPNYPTPAPIPYSESYRVVAQNYIGDYVVREWFTPLDISSYYSRFFTISSLGQEQEKIETGIGGWELMDLTNDGSPEIVFNINTGMRCCYGKVAYNVKSAAKILDAYDSYCDSKFSDMDGDGILEYVGCDRHSLYSAYCSEAGTPITTFILQYNPQTNLYSPASPKFSYTYNHTLKYGETYLLEYGYDNLCSISSVMFSYLYSGRTDKAWELAEKYTGKESPEEIKSLALQAIRSPRYVDPNLFKPFLSSTIELPQTYDHRFGNEIKFSLNDKMLALRNKDTIYVFDVNTGDLIGIITSSDGNIIDFSFGLNDSSIAYITNGERMDVRLWNLETGEDKTIYTPKYRSFCLAFMPDGTDLAICSGNEIIIVNSITSKRLRTYEVPTEEVAPWSVNPLCHLTIHPKATKIIAVGGLDCNHIFLWDTKTKEMTSTWVGGTINTIMFNPSEDTFILSGYYGTMVEIFNSNNSEWVDIISPAKGDIAITPNGKNIIYAKGYKLFVADIQSHDNLYVLDQEPFLDFRETTPSPNEGFLLGLPPDIELSHKGNILASLPIKNSKILLWRFP